MPSLHGKLVSITTVQTWSTSKSAQPMSVLGFSAEVYKIIAQRLAADGKPSSANRRRMNSHHNLAANIGDKSTVSLAIHRRLDGTGPSLLASRYIPYRNRFGRRRSSRNTGRATDLCRAVRSSLVRRFCLCGQGTLRSLVCSPCSLTGLTSGPQCLAPSDSAHPSARSLVLWPAPSWDFFSGLPGVFFGPFIGAVIGELSAQRSLEDAARAGFGATIGLVLGVALKLALGFSMIGIFAVARFF